jgi:hypothetical protein
MLPKSPTWSEVPTAGTVGPGRVAGGPGRVAGGPGRVAGGPGRVAGGPGRVAGGVLYAEVGCPQPGQPCCGFPEVAFQGMCVEF